MTTVKETGIARETGIGNVKKTATEMTGIAMIDTETTGAETVTETTEEMTVVALTHQTAKTGTDVNLHLL